MNDTIRSAAAVAQDNVDVLAPQPPPLVTAGSKEAWPEVIREYKDEVLYWSVLDQQNKQDLTALMAARHQQGIEKYGVALTVDNGRDHSIDALQEALDLQAYLCAGNAPSHIKNSALRLLENVYLWHRSLQGQT